MTNFRLRALLALVLVGGFLLFNLFKNESARSSGDEIVLETQPIDPRDIFFGHFAVLSYDIETLSREQTFRLIDSGVREEAKRFLRAGEHDVPHRYRVFSERPIFVALDKKSDFHEPVLATLDREKANNASLTVLEAQWQPVEFGRECEEGETAGADCEWYVSIEFELPDRYYADKATALALENKQRAAARAEADRRLFEECERARAENENARIPEQCDGVGEPAPAEKFGVILSVSDNGNAAIKGVMIGEDRYYDSLSGARLSKEKIVE